MDEGRGFTIIDYEDRYKQALEDISLPWLLEYDLLEPVDLAWSCWSFRGRASASCSSSV